MPGRTEVSTLGLTLDEWLEGYRSGRWSPSILFEHLDALRRDDPAWTRLVEREELGAQLDELASRGEPQQLELYGVPFAVKDNVDVAGLPTTAACPAFAHTPARDAEVVARLRAQGAIVLGKTNLDQFATGLVGTRSPYGSVPSAFDARYVGGGSSSGSGSVVARGLVPFALGTDTAGSGRVPAAFQNVVGIKPTLGRLSTRGVVPACRSLDCVSVFALTVDDGARVAELAAGYDAECPESRREEVGREPASPRRLAVPARLDFAGDERARAAFEATRRELTEAGFVFEELDFEPFAQLARLLYEGPWVAERLLVVEPLLRERPEAIHPVVREIVEGGARFSALDAFRAGYRRAESKRAIERALEGFAALVVPTTPTIYTIDEVLADPVRKNSVLGTYTNFTNLAELSAVALPGRFRDDGLPAGITLLAPAWQDGPLARLAREIQARLALPLGATGRPWSSDLARRPAPRADVTRLVVVGAHLSGLALNHQLTSRGGELLETTRTAPRYRLYVMPGTSPIKPALLRVEAGHAIEVEVWQLPNERVAEFLADVPPPLALGSLELASGEWVRGFVAEPRAFEGAEDISAHGGFRAWLFARA